MPILPISKTKLDKLGDRLRDSTDPDPADLDLLNQVLRAYQGALLVVLDRLRLLGFVPVQRLKTTGTIIDKLRRDRVCSLKTIHDLAGARVVLTGDLDAQDALVESFCASSPPGEPPPVRIDRRVDPRAGYRAVHVVVRVDGIPVEVQFRTKLQHDWAQLFERLADMWGRQVRYGGALAADPRPGMIDAKNEIIVLMFDHGAKVAKYEELCCSDAIKRMEAEAARLKFDSAEPDDNVSPDRLAVRSNYLAYRAARDEAESQFDERLAELTLRIESLEAR
ncbi:nucleotidyltransferase family protein [Paractinoplanes durhamensis]|uniref:RelA/SpoT domain-containing protein n=1 Tax=Paractinoplanes durhamensis TaxID=113563 RepID=A0ABQ3ZBX4_9ACTN|nr:hypothetical protein [Actinoplanes durhamensis]GIE07330.1 hypothetical protein Adu01nite_86800 [Actinoplanes durhamensis]